MKTIPTRYLLLTAFLTVFFMNLISIQNVNAQGKDEKNIICIKLISEDKGTTIKIDTTFDPQEFDEENFRKTIKEKYGIDIETEIEADKFVWVSGDEASEGATVITEDDDDDK
jgi:hypothetical protein